MSASIPGFYRPAWCLALEFLNDRAEQGPDGSLIVPVWEDSFFHPEVSELIRMGFLLPLPAPPGDELNPSKQEYELISNWKEVRALRLAAIDAKLGESGSPPLLDLRTLAIPRTDVAMFVDYDNMFLTGEKYPGEKFDLGRMMRLWQPFGDRLVVANLYTSRLTPTIQVGVDTSAESIADMLEKIQPSLLRRNYTLMEFIREGFRPIVLPSKGNGGREGKDVDAAMSDDILSSIQLLPSLKTVIIASHDHAFQYLASRLKRTAPEIQLIAFVEDSSAHIARAVDGYVNLRSPLVRQINALLAPGQGAAAGIVDRLVNHARYESILEIIAHMVPVLKRAYRDADYIASPSYLRNLVYADHEFTFSKRISEIETMAVLKLFIRLGIITQTEGPFLPLERDGEEMDESPSGAGEKPRLDYKCHFAHPLLLRLLEAAEDAKESSASFE